MATTAVNKAQEQATRYAVGYARVSTLGQADEGVSLEAQQAAIARFCKAQGLELLEVCVDAGVSGAAELGKRPGLLAALELVRKHKASLVAYKRDRIARDVVLAATVERMAQSAKGAVLTVEGDNGNSPEAALMRVMVDAFAQYERALIAARTRAALAHKKSKGERTGEVPFGSQLAADGVKLEQCAAEQEVLRLVAELRNEGLSLRAITAQLEARGVLNRAGKPLTLTSVARMVKAA
jgi:DNA invertase Pin-like site-specific DNA recombinase